ncbi:MAG: hypothetical protein ACPGVH_08360 [Chitinophagales bacterium]
MFDSKGSLISNQTSKVLNVVQLEKGIYFVILNNKHNEKKSFQFEKH